MNKIEFDMETYSLTLGELCDLVRDFQTDCFDGFVSNDKSYITLWLEKHGKIPTLRI